MKERKITNGKQGCRLSIEASTDSDFGARLDTRRSVPGAVVILAKGVVTCRSRMQAMTASGTSEVEYVTLSEEVKEVVFLGQVQDFMESSMRILHATRRTKHIEMKHHLEKNACDAGKIRIGYVITEDLHAD